MSRHTVESVSGLIREGNLEALRAEVAGKTALQWCLDQWQLNGVKSPSLKDLVFGVLRVLANDDDALVAELNFETANAAAKITVVCEGVSKLDPAKQILVYTHSPSLVPKRYYNFMPQVTFDVLVRHMQRNQATELEPLLVKAAKRSRNIASDSELSRYQQIRDLHLEVAALKSQYEGKPGKSNFVKHQVLSKIEAVFDRYMAGRVGFDWVRSAVTSYLSQLKVNRGKCGMAFPLVSRMQGILASLKRVSLLDSAHREADYGEVIKLVDSDYEALSGSEVGQHIKTFLHAVNYYPDIVELVLQSQFGRKLLSAMAMDLKPKYFSNVLDLVDEFWLEDKLQVFSLLKGNLGLLQNTLALASRLSGDEELRENARRSASEADGGDEGRVLEKLMGRRNLLEERMLDNASLILKSIKKLSPEQQLDLLASGEIESSAIYQAAYHCPEFLDDILLAVFAAIEAAPAAIQEHYDFEVLVIGVFPDEHDKFFHAGFVKAMRTIENQELKESIETILVKMYPEHEAITAISPTLHELGVVELDRADVDDRVEIERYKELLEFLLDELVSHRCPSSVFGTIEQVVKDWGEYNPNQEGLGKARTWLKQSLGKMSIYYLARFLRQGDSARAKRALTEIKKKPSELQLSLLEGNRVERDAVYLAAHYCPDLLPVVLQTLKSAIEEQGVQSFYSWEKILKIALGGEHSRRLHASLVKFALDNPDYCSEILSALSADFPQYSSITSIPAVINQLITCSETEDLGEVSSQEINEMKALLENCLNELCGEEFADSPLAALVAMVDGWGEFDRSSKLGEAKTFVQQFLRQYQVQLPAQRQSAVDTSVFRQHDPRSGSLADDSSTYQFGGGVGK